MRNDSIEVLAPVETHNLFGLLLRHLSATGLLV